MFIVLLFLNSVLFTLTLPRIYHFTSLSKRDANIKFNVLKRDSKAKISGFSIKI